MAPYALNIDALNDICVAYGGNGGHTFTIDALNEWAALVEAGGGGSPSNSAPTDIALSASTVAEDAALGTVVGTLSGTDPDAGDTLTFTLTDDAGGKFAISGTNLIVAGVLDYETATSHSITVRATDAGGLTYDEVMTITVTDVAETPPTDPLPTDGTTTDDGTFANGPSVTSADGSIKLSGKKSTGSGKFLYSIGAPVASRKYTCQYDPDFTLLSNTGKNAFVGFGFKNASGAYEFIGLKGDGATGLDATRIAGASITSTSGATVTTVNAADNGTQAGPNWIQLEIDAAGTGYTFRTSADGTTWADETTGSLPSSSTDIGIAAYFAAGDTGPFSVAISVWTNAAAAVNAVATPLAYSGTGSTRSVTGAGFSPDLAIFKARGTTTGWRWVDNLRGAGVSLDSSGIGINAAEATGLTSFDVDGFTIGADADYNASAGTFVAYALQEFAEAFDMLTYTGTGVARTVAHGLGAVPELIIVKNYSGSNANWSVYSSVTGATNALLLNGTNASSAVSGLNWNSTAPTSSVFSLGTAAGVNGNGVNFIAYLFASKAGVSKVGSYTGTGTTSGATITCGFRPKLVLLKATSTTGDWAAFDSARDTTSPHTIYSKINATAAESNSATGGITFTDTGFQITDSAVANTSGATYLYLALA